MVHLLRRTTVRKVRTLGVETLLVIVELGQVEFLLEVEGSDINLNDISVLI